MVDIQIDFDAGSRRDPPSQAGLASAVAAMMSKGVHARDNAAALDEIRALLGAAPRRRDLLIEHLHKIQDRYGAI